MGLKMGVVASLRELLDADAGLTEYSSSAVESGGNESQVDVTRRERSTALRYFPTEL